MKKQGLIPIRHRMLLGGTAIAVCSAFISFLIMGKTLLRVPAPPGGGSARAAGAGSVSHPRLAETYGKLPLSFEINRGQTDPHVKFLSRGSGYSLFLTGNEAVLALKKPGVRGQKSVAPPFRAAHPGSAELFSKSAVFPGLLPTAEQFKESFAPREEARIPNLESRAPAMLRMRLVGANPQANVGGLDELPGKSNYFIGNDPKKWRTNVPSYARLKYASVYPGVDLVYYGNQRQLEYDFVVKPGADPRQIVLDVGAGLARPKSGQKGGADLGLKSAAFFGFTESQAAELQTNSALHLDANGDLVVGTDGGEVIFHKPVVYQPATENGQRTTDFIHGSYVLKGDQVTFDVTSYDKTRPLVIDPVLAYSTYLGANRDSALGIAVDASGNAYVTGYTTPSDEDDFPTTSGAFQTTYGGGGYYGYGDAFVSKLNPAGSALVYSTYLGGNGADIGAGIAVDAAGNAYVTGYTQSYDFPTTPGAFQTTCGRCGSHGSDEDAFVSKLNPAGSALVYSTYLGGSYSRDSAWGIAIDASGNAYVTGSTSYSDFPTTPGSFQTTWDGVCNDYCPSDAFVSKLNAAGSALLYSTYLGGSGNDGGTGVAIDAAGNAYVTGSTTSSDFPTTPDAFQTTSGGGSCPERFDGCSDAFVSKLNPAGSALVYSTYLGGSGVEIGSGIAIDASGDVYVTGFTASSNFPTTPDAFQTTSGGGSCPGACPDAFVSKLNAVGSALVYSMYLGGRSFDWGLGIAVDASGNAYVTGRTYTSDFPTTPGAFQTTLNGPGGDAFVSKLNAAGSVLGYSTYLGGSGGGAGVSVALDARGNAYVTGDAGFDFPTTPGALRTTLPIGPQAVFVAKLSISDVPFLELTPSSLNFGPQVVGTTGAAQKVRLSNAGAKALNITSILASGDFAQTNDCPGSVAPAGFCTFSVTFTPTVAGIRTGDITISDNAAGSPHKVPLTGSGGIPVVSLTSASLTFASQAVGTTSPAQPTTLKNTGTGPLSITSIAVAGDFAQTTNCGSKLNPGVSCTLSVTFTPTATGTRSGVISITDDAPGSPHRVSLTGTGFNGGPVVSLSPTSLTFAAQPVATFSPAQLATLKNTGGAALKITRIGPSGDFYEGNNCPTTLAPNASCTLRVTFTPTSTGTRSGTVTIWDNAAGSPHKLSLSGTGSGTGSITLTLSPSALSFASVTVGATSSTQTVTLTNIGTAAASFLEPFGFASGENLSGFYKNPHCGTSLAPKASCTVSVFFKPLATGTRTGFFLVRQGAASKQIPLSGTGTP